MARAATAAQSSPTQQLDDAAPSLAGAGGRTLLWQLMVLSLPVLGENLLHMFVGFTDVYLAGHLPADVTKPATAAVGSIAYVMWLIGLIAGTIGTGSTAVIARAVGGRHRSLANSVCGQSIAAAALTGIVLGACAWVFAGPVARVAGLEGEARDFAIVFLRIIAVSLPFSTVMFTANACLRGAGDTLTPFISMAVVDGTNVLVSASLVNGWFGLPAVGFRGIAIGTMVAYIVGGLFQFVVLVRGNGGVRLHLHRMRPHWHTLKRILRIGLPSGADGMITWVPQFIILSLINGMDAENVAGSAHIVTIRLESLSFLGGFAIATAAATMVGQSLGMKDPVRAARSAYLSYAVGGGWMFLCGVAFVLIPARFAALLNGDPRIIDLAARCLFVAGFAQLGFAASLVFGFALRGAGETFPVMVINLACVLLLRFGGVLVAVLVLGMGLEAVWVVLSTELTIRGGLVFGRFLTGKWKTVEV